MGARHPHVTSFVCDSYRSLASESTTVFNKAIRVMHIILFMLQPGFDTQRNVHDRVLPQLWLRHAGGSTFGAQGTPS